MPGAASTNSWTARSTAIVRSYAAMPSWPAGSDPNACAWGCTFRHARISEDQASAFWERMAELVSEFDRLPRSGEVSYGFAIGIYPTDQPTLPD